MKILNCSIENFGCFSKKRFDFTDGLNVISRKNGYGKSTLTAFIRVMFYGFMNETRKKEAEKERNRFRPWGGGVYGGELTFEKDGREYIITRIFGTKPKEDEFLLRDAKTGMPVSDYSEKIGEEIFAIDSDSFLRTVVISENGCDTGNTGSISAKLGQLAENTGDIESFEKVEKRFKDLINSLSPDKSTGKVKKLKEELSQIREEQRRTAGVDSGIDELKSMRRQKTKEAEKLEHELGVIKERLALISAEKDRQNKKQQYDDLCREFNDRNRAYGECEAYFKGVEIEVSDIDKATKLAYRINELNASLATDMNIPASDSDYDITEEELKKLIAEENNMLSLARTIPSKKSAADAMQKLIIEKETALRKLENERKERIGRFESESYARQQRLNKKGTRLKLTGILIILIFLFAAGLMIAIKPSAEAVIVGVIAGEIFLLLVGVGLLAAGISIPRKYVEDVPLDNTKTEAEKAEELSLAAYKEELAGMTEALLEDEERIKKAKETEARYAELLKIDGRDEFFLSALIALSNRLNNLDALRKRSAETNKALDEAKTEIRKITAGLEIDFSGDVPEQLLLIKDRLVRLGNARKEYEVASARRREFEKNNDMSLLKSDKSVKELAAEHSVEELSKELTQITDRLNETYKGIRDINDRLTQMYEEKEKLDRDAVKIEEEQKELDRLKHQHDVLVMTNDYLNRAKVSFTSKYMGPISSGFKKYFELISADGSGDYEVDADMDIRVKKSGMPRDLRYMSKGQRDLAGVCMRMALISAMYKGEKPFVVLDDPFMGFDDEKVSRVRRFLYEIAKDYQVIYFTCSDSRT